MSSLPRASLCLLSSGHSSISASPVRLVVHNTGLFKGLTREADVSGNSFHGDLFHSKWISFLNLAWPEVFLQEGRQTSGWEQGTIFSWDEIWELPWSLGQTSLFIYGGVFNPPPQASAFDKSPFLVWKKLKSRGHVNWYSLTFGDIQQTATFLSGRGGAGGAVKLNRSLEHQAWSQQSSCDEYIYKMQI